MQEKVKKTFSVRIYRFFLIGYAFYSENSNEPKVDQEKTVFSAVIEKETHEENINSSNQKASPATVEKRKAPKRKNDGNTKLSSKQIKTNRYDGLSHWPAIDSRKNASRCKNEGCTFKTHFYCSKCEVHLCIRQARNCFEDFHILDDKTAETK